ncbi:MAG: VOC family protein [Bdellovibrionales bacterium]|nr:VOC family protein [Bdellovibrionales bacterium]
MTPEPQHNKDLKMTTAPKINLLVIKVRNLEDSVAFYKLLGIEFEEHKHDNGPKHYAAIINDFVFEIYPAQEGSLTENTVRIGFCTENIEVTRDLLKEQAVEFLHDIEKKPWGTCLVVLDPDKNRIQISKKN